MGQEGEEKEGGGGGNATAVAAVRLHDGGVELAMNIRMRVCDGPLCRGARSDHDREEKIILNAVAGIFQMTSVWPCLGPV